MKKILCLLVLTGATTIQSMVPANAVPAVRLAMPDMNQTAAPYFQPGVPAIPEQHPTIQAMRALDAQCMVHPDVAVKHMKMLQEAYAAGYSNGYQIGIKQAGQYMQACLNGAANVLTTKNK